MRTAGTGWQDFERCFSSARGSVVVGGTGMWVPNGGPHEVLRYVGHALHMQHQWQVDRPRGLLALRARECRSCPIGRWGLPEFPRLPPLHSVALDGGLHETNVIRRLAPRWYLSLGLSPLKL